MYVTAETAAATALLSAKAASKNAPTVPMMTSAEDAIPAWTVSEARNYSAGTAITATSALTMSARAETAARIVLWSARTAGNTAITATTISAPTARPAKTVLRAMAGVMNVTTAAAVCRFARAAAAA